MTPTTTVPIAEPDLGRAEYDRVSEVLRSGQLADGPLVREFERAFSDHCDAACGVATANGTAALHAALVALGIAPGDRVVTTPFSFVATANAVRLAGAEPVFADVDPETYTLDPDAVETVLRETDDVAALLPVHLFGHPAAMDHLVDLADSYELALVEDAAQAHGAEYDGRPVGTFGDAACFSFYPTKNMTTGEGGMVTTDREDVADAVARFVDHGRGDRRGEHVSVGHNFRMTSLAAAIGLAQIEKLPAYTRIRRRNARLLSEGLDGAPLATPTEAAASRHVYHQYTVEHERRDRLADSLERRGIETGVYYPTPIHQQPAYADVEVDAPVAERVADRVLSLPVHPGLTDDDVARVVDAVVAFAGVSAR